MKYICLGYYEPAAFEAISETARAALLGEVLRKHGEYLGGVALDGPPPPAEAATTTTLRFEPGKVVVTEGPPVETKVLGGVMVLEAVDLNHAIQLMSKLHAMRVRGWVEIRPIDEAAPEGKLI
jgi:hypothetical protein